MPFGELIISRGIREWNSNPQQLEFYSWGTRALLGGHSIFLVAGICVSANYEHNHFIRKSESNLECRKHVTQAMAHRLRHHPGTLHFLTRRMPSTLKRWIGLSTRNMPPAIFNAKHVIILHPTDSWSCNSHELRWVICAVRRCPYIGKWELLLWLGLGTDNIARLIDTFWPRCFQMKELSTCRKWYTYEVLPNLPGGDLRICLSSIQNGDSDFSSWHRRRD